MTVSPNWVKARSECSLNSVFRMLLEAVKSDIDAAREVGIVKISIQSSHNKFSVVRDEEDIGPITKPMRLVIFELSKIEISVKDGADKPMFSARPHLSNDGKCLLQVSNQPYELWQISRLALEDLFFGQ